MRDIKESDWKIFKGLRKVALERFCGEIAGINSDTTKTKTSATRRSTGSSESATRRSIRFFDHLR
jgi:hypothetical protein